MINRNQRVRNNVTAGKKQKHKSAPRQQHNRCLHAILAAYHVLRDLGVVIQVHDVLAVRRQAVRPGPQRSRLVALGDEAVPTNDGGSGYNIR